VGGAFTLVIALLTAILEPRIAALRAATLARSDAGEAQAPSSTRSGDASG